jgi:hypothetical protein
VDNAFAEFGALSHKLFEEWATGQLMSFELANAFMERFDQCVLHAFPPFPRDLGQRYYDAGLQYFRNFDGFGDDSEVAAVERKFQLDVLGYPFIGYIDLVLRRTDGSIRVIDHKSSSINTYQKKKLHFLRQLYLYSEAVRHLFHQSPSILSINLFREHMMLDDQFDVSKSSDLNAWISQTIDAIRKDRKWKALPSSFFCRFLCSSGAYCPEQI